MAPEAGSEDWQARRLFRRSSEADAGLSLNLAEMNGARGRSYAALGLMAHQQLVSYGGHQERLTPDRRASSIQTRAAPRRGSHGTLTAARMRSGLSIQTQRLVQNLWRTGFT